MATIKINQVDYNADYVILQDHLLTIKLQANHGFDTDQEIESVIFNDTDLSSFTTIYQFNIYDDTVILSDDGSVFVPIDPGETQAPQGPSEADLAWDRQVAEKRALEEIVLNTVVTDEADALKVSGLFPEWTVGNSYTTGQFANYGYDLYQALQDSTATTEHTPDVATSLWKKVGKPNEDGIMPWTQPVGATDAYKAGDKVTHNGHTWQSTANDNVWEPGVYGWEQVA